ncbi:transposase Tn5 [Sphingobium indicum BiD32]|uniref:Transposase Tn5 n=1 Tax=Sphingobium indicum BiD32 TaxID=1301087 RepID=N1MUD8_9SPHN|nr:transposase Tn5 [Sphingobium indicum BiD32]
MHSIEVRIDNDTVERVTLDIRYKRIHVCPPIGKQKRYPALDLTVIHASEVGVPLGRKPILWKLVTGHFFALTDWDSPPDTRIRTAHLPTPETAISTHYFIHHARNFATQDEQVARLMHQQLSAAFTEDVEALTAIETLVSATAPDDIYEISLASDRAGIAMRRSLWKKSLG